MSVFEAALGPSFAALPPALQTFHKGAAHRSFTGHAEVTRGTGLLAAASLKFGGFPPASTHTSLRVTVTTNGHTETWERAFGAHRLTSTLVTKGHQIHECLGPFSCTLAPRWDGTKLHVPATRITFAGLPLPGFLTPESRSVEWQEGGAFAFDIAAYLPGDRLLIRYKGILRPA